MKRRKKKIVPTIKLKKDIQDKMFDFLNANHPKTHEEIEEFIEAIARALVFVISSHFIKYDKKNTENFLANLHAGIKDAFKARKDAE